MIRFVRLKKILLAATEGEKAKTEQEPKAKHNNTPKNSKNKSSKRSTTEQQTKQDKKPVVQTATTTPILDDIETLEDNDSEMYDDIETPKPMEETVVTAQNDVEEEVFINGNRRAYFYRNWLCSFIFFTF